MPQSSGTTLIVGADGKVGRALDDHLRLAGQPVAATSRRPSADRHTHFLDLAGDVAHWLIPPGVTTAVVCAANPRIDACESDPEGTTRVNVIGTLTLIRRLIAQDVFTVFLSTNQVFDGDMPHTRPETCQSPVSAYGRQKTTVEQELLELADRAAIVRFTKILEPIVPLFETWRQTLEAGQPIEPFTDMWMAPVPLASAVSALRLIADHRAGGVWQVSGDRDLSYADVASLLALHLKADPDLVRPTSARAGGRVTAHLPANTTLCVDRLRHELGLQPPPVEWTVCDALTRT